jgi:hypothetical protein
MRHLVSMRLETHSQQATTQSTVWHGMAAWSRHSNRHMHSTYSPDERVLSPAGQLLQLVDELSMYDPALHPEPLAHITSSSPAAAAHPDCSGKSTVMLLLPTAVTVPTLEWVTAPHPYCGLDTDGSTCTRLPTCTCCEQLDEEEEMQAVAPAVPGPRH